MQERGPRWTFRNRGSLGGGRIDDGGGGSWLGAFCAVTWLNRGGPRPCPGKREHGARGRQAFCSLEIVSIPWYSAFGLRTLVAGHRQ
jgi:hypothetical protein